LNWLVLFGIESGEIVREKVLENGKIINFYEKLRNFKTSIKGSLQILIL
jgi:hypothetical protein